MPIPNPKPPGILLARGVCRALAAQGCASLIEVPLPNSRRADVMAIEPSGELWIIEVKSSIEDFRTDHKWAEYRPFCDRLYFAVPDHFPKDLIPEACGLIGADAYGAEILRAAPLHPLNAARRKAVTLRFARLAASRLLRLHDPAAATLA